jgi:adenylate cyclase
MTHNPRLAAILSTNTQDHAVRETITRFRGRIVDGTGNDLLADFASVVDAVDCAVMIQRTLSEHNAVLPAERRLEVGIGLSLGDVLIDGERLHGQALDVAVGLQRVAEPGEILISGMAYEQVATNLPYRYEAVRDPSIEHIAAARRVYRVSTGDLPVAGRETSAPTVRAARLVPRAHKPSIAVLPFREYDIRQGRSYFADGIVEDIIGALASLPDVFVISRSSTLGFAGANADVRAVAATLGVQYVLSGSVRRSAEKIRTLAELCDTESGGILWTDSLEGSVNDVFALQDRLSERIVTTIAPHVRRAELRRALRKRPESLDAYDFVLRGLDLLYRLRREEFQQARVMFERAIDLDPMYATPYALSANWHSIRIGQGWSDNLADDLDAVNRLATAALERDPFDARALALCGHVRAFVFRDHDGAMALFHRAIAAAPNSSEAWVWSSPTYSYVGDGAEAARRAEHSLRLSPLDPHVFLNHTALALAHYTSGNFNGAVTFGRMATTENPRYTAAQRILIASLVAAARLDEARSVARMLLELEPAFHVEPFCHAHPYRDSLRREALARHLSSAGLPN